MSVNNNYLWSFDDMTEDLETNQELTSMPSYNPGNGYEQAMQGNGPNVFGHPVLYPPFMAHNLYAPQQPICPFTNSPDLSVPTSFSGTSSQFLPATSTPANSGFPSTASPFSFLGQTTSNTSLPALFSNTSNGNSQACPRMIDSNHSQEVSSGVPSQMQNLPFPAAPTAQCPPAPGSYQQTIGQSSNMDSPALQPVPQQSQSAPLFQYRISDQPVASVHPQHTSESSQQQFRGSSTFGLGPTLTPPSPSRASPQFHAGSSMGRRSTFSTAPVTSQIVLRGPNDNVNVNLLGPLRHPGVPHHRYPRIRRTLSQTPRYDASRLSSSNYISRHSLPKGLDDPLDKRPEPKETAEMTLNMECKVCMSQPVDTAVFPCGHAMLCRWCAEKCVPSHRSEKSRSKEPPRCPMCRGVVRNKLRIFLT